MTERNYTSAEMRSIAVQAALEVLARRPVPSAVTAKQAAEMLEVSPRTVARMGLPRNGAGLIPYTAVLDALSSK